MCMPNLGLSQIVGTVQHNIGITNQLLSQTFTESFWTTRLRIGFEKGFVA